MRYRRPESGIAVVNGEEATAVDIRIGGWVEHESERSTLREIVRLLASNGRPAVVFANFEVASRQIDLLVALDGLALVIEAKGFTRAVRGGENGAWQVHLASGHWRDFRNPYQQALGAALAVKDAMGNFAGTGAPFVKAALVFVPGIPPGSRVFQGNRKVLVIGQDGLRAELGKRLSDDWSIDRWKEFASDLGLRSVSSVCAACDPGLAEAEDRLRQYRAMFCRTYGKGKALVPFLCRLDGETIPSDDVACLVFDRRGGLLLRGPSGCGKSMLITASGVAFGDLGGVPINLQGKEFGGSVKELVEREATLLGAPSGVQLLKDARQLGQPILFIVDGYNECAEDMQGRFTRAIAALAGRYEGGVVVASQVTPVRGDLLDLQEIDVPAPTMETKFAIAEAASEGKAQLELIERLLAAVSTGLEASLVGEVGATINPGSSRYALFDTFARNRLGRPAVDGIRVLSELAGWLCERFAFSLSIREFDRLMDVTSVPTELREQVIDRGLLALRGDRVSFPHEMFLDAFAAEAVVRQARGRPEPVLKAVASPLHAARKDLVIGAIDDDFLLERVLPKLEDHASIRACIQGQCGSHAQEWAEEHCRRLWVRLREEACNVRFRMSGEGLGRVEFEESSPGQWSRCDQAFFDVLTERMVGGRHLEDAFDIVGILDRRIADESLRLSKETGIGATKLRSDMFVISYKFPQRSSGAPGISKICADLDSGLSMERSGHSRRPGESRPGDIRQEVLEGELSPGQIHLFLMLSRWGKLPASFISSTIEAQWENAPYHLQLALMDFAAIGCTAEGDVERAKLIETIEGLLTGCTPFVASIAMEALKRLGALEEGVREHRTVVLENVRNRLARPTDCECQTEAWRVYSAQFDHPYSDAYCEVVANLVDRDRKTLLEMASRGVRETKFCLGLLLLELASFGDQDVGESIGRWTRPPPADNPTMPQIDICAFVVAHIALARLGCPLPNHRTTSDNVSTKALNACGAILYWINLEDLDEDGRLKACKPELAVLSQNGRGGALDVLRECEHVSGEGFELLPGDGPVLRSVVGQYPAEAAAISRDALRDPTSQAGYFRYWSRFDKDQILAFGIKVLESYGNRSDRSLLRQYASSQKHGRRAIAALRAIEERVTRAPGSAV